MLAGVLAAGLDGGPDDAEEAESEAVVEDRLAEGVADVEGVVTDSEVAMGV